jgi:DNA (cytosine-5)-methyltransferase 1
MVTLNDPLTAVDLFSGAGGLTLGLKQTGINVVAAVEIDPRVAKTYAVNHPEVKLLIKDARDVTGKEILKATKLKKIDLVTGCPPCQGFSKLTYKYKREDPRNELIMEMARLIEELRPKIVMMENVPGIETRGKSILKRFVDRFKAEGYVINQGVLQMADYGVPQSRRRFVLVAGRGFEIPLPSVTHNPKGNKEKGLFPWVTIGDVIKYMPPPISFSVAKRRGGAQLFNWHVVSELQEISIQRLKVLGSGGNRAALPKDLRPPCHKNSDKGFDNVYGRLKWDMVAPTITRGFTTTCMGRFGHPEELRALSVREAALIQTFPLNYKFEAEFLKTACDLVGNAFPPKFAKRLAQTCLEAFEAHTGGVR